MRKSSEPAELSLTGRKETPKVVTSHLYSGPVELTHFRAGPTSHSVFSILALRASCHLLVFLGTNLHHEQDDRRHHHNDNEQRQTIDNSPQAAPAPNA
ncbi:hypothetical protein EVAR_81796_1 [Eumeta japonica]|uniref:Uncharacterized protein n=1 Tax=Eumeta variegata TaxID=151549 RepID=A0A4C1UHI1_EUMVA|nr:hypothetical protein EVAR_81796_1 [Eumeta japonica]